MLLVKTMGVDYYFYNTTRGVKNLKPVGKDSNIHWVPYADELHLYEIKEIFKYVIISNSWYVEDKIVLSAGDGFSYHYESGHISIKYVVSY